MTLQSSPEQPIPVRAIASRLVAYIGRIGQHWIEGQVTQLRPHGGTCYLVLRDPDVDMSLRVSCWVRLIEQLQPPLAEGTRVVMCARPQFRAARGDLSFVATDIRPVGVGALLARLERLKATLAAEGLFDPARKRPLPLLPRRVGLITGRGSAAERDVVENARRRWPPVQFTCINVPVQGPSAALAVTAALRRLDADPEVDVIVIARGGGSVEDLLPFSDEGLLRAVVEAATPVVSAIGHESDTPLLDFVADRRASTPTDAGKLIVPDLAEQTRMISELRRRGHAAVSGLVNQEIQRLAAVRARPVLADPTVIITVRADQVERARDRAWRATRHAVSVSAEALADLTGRLRALSPQATLDRGYAVVQRADGSVVRRAAAVEVGERLSTRLAEGRLDVAVEGVR